MAHSDWVNQSSRVVNAKAIVKAYDSFKSSFSLGSDGEDSRYFIVSFSDSAKEYARYLQISGNKDKNIYPVDLRITNSRIVGTTGEDLVDITITNNNSSDLILELKDVKINSEIDIIVTKWSKYINNNDITINNYTDYITYIGTTIQFDLIKCNMLKSFETENGLCYDGTSELSYGIKTNESSLEVTKDIPNTGIAESTIDVSERITSLVEYNIGNQYSYNSDPNKTDYVRVFIPSDSTTNIVSGHKYFGMYQFYTYLYKDYSSVEDDFNVYLEPQVTSGIAPSSLAGSNINVGKYKYSTSYFYGSWNSSYSNVNMQLRPYKFLSSAIYEFLCSVTNQAFIDLTEIFGIGNEPTLEWCKENFSFSGVNSIHYSETRSTKYPILSRSEMCIKLENKPYIQFSMALDTEITGKKIGNYYIDTFDYDEEKPTFTLNIKDNTKLLTENISNSINSGVSIDNEDGVKSVNILFNKYINSGLKRDTGLELDVDLDNSVELNTMVYPLNVYYSEIYNKFCQALKTYICQDIDDIKRISLINKYKQVSRYNISNNKCFNISILNNLSNSIKNVSCETCITSDNQQYEKLQESSVYSTLLDGYVIPEQKKEENISSTYNILNRVLVPKLSSNGNTISGSFEISRDLYSKYQNFNIRLYGARAKFILKITILTFTLDGQGVPSGTNGETKNYIHIDDESVETIVTSISELSENDYEDIKWQSSDISFEVSENNVIVNYFITLNAVQDSIGNSEIQQIQPFSSIVGQELTNEKYLGAYKIVLFGSNYNSTYNTIKYSIGNGNSYNVSGNEFIQSGCKAILPNLSYSESPSINSYIASSIFEEFGNGVKTAEIEWVGSPYIELFDLITLDNGITYRVHYIKNRYDGGYRQTLRLVEYKE